MRNCISLNNFTASLSSPFWIYAESIAFHELTLGQAKQSNT
uniref:Uncharacterized protein n=1 Tax=Rhizophora mucronata TaxID=61149 RepID=A0A2P2JBF3_RHIMU